MNSQSGTLSKFGENNPMTNENNCNDCQNSKLVFWITENDFVDFEPCENCQ